MTLLEVENLCTQYRSKKGTIHAVEDVSFELDNNEVFGLVGESGSGKSTIAKSINGVLDDNAEISGGSIRFKGEDLLEMSEKEMRDIRWQEISMIPQTAMSALNPVYTVAAQFAEVITHHEDTSRKEAIERGKELFELVNLDPDRINNYPHQFSGGMLQRVMIALALALEPSIILADEPTTALDVIVQDKILNELKRLQDELGFSIILITHDISVVSETCDNIGVVYGGRLVEKGTTKQIIKNPRHPYTMGLRNAFPSIEVDSQELLSIPGKPPTLIEPEAECRFVDRCPFAEKGCYESLPKEEYFEDGHRVECIRADEAEELRKRAENHELWRAQKEEIINE